MLVSIVASSYEMDAQNVQVKKEQYYTWVDVMEGEDFKKGVLVGMDERQLFIVQNRYLPKWIEDLDPQKSRSIPITNVDVLKFRKHNKPLYTSLKGALFGGIGGGVVFAISNDCHGFFCLSDSEAFGVGFVLGGLSGAIIGAITGSEKIEIPIGGRHDRYTKQKNKIKEFLY
jgi:hypothetical protein